MGDSRFHRRGMQRKSDTDSIWVAHADGLVVTVISLLGKISSRSGVYDYGLR